VTLVLAEVPEEYTMRRPRKQAAETPASAPAAEGSTPKAKTRRRKKEVVA
jgi:hypothetical protein